MKTREEVPSRVLSDILTYIRKNPPDLCGGSIEGTPFFVPILY